jgi:hypothetical protein
MYANFLGKESGMEVVATITDFFHNYQFISIVGLVVILYFLYQSPKETFKFLLLVAAMAAAGYFVLQLGDSTDPGVSTKKELTHKTTKALGE